MPSLVSHMTFWAPISTPMTEPTMDMSPNFMSTLPILRCLAVATMDLPKMWARSVPMA